MTKTGIIVLQRVRRFEVGSVDLVDRLLCSAWLPRLIIAFLIFVAGWIVGYFQVRAQMGK